jgi:DNA polymerase-1
LQNIPIRTDKGKEVRKAFVSSFRNGLIMSADYSQIELRIMAYYSKDATLMEAFQSNQDVHTLTAARLFDKKLEEVDSESRRVAKTVNFGIMYGLGAFGLAQRLRIPRNTAAKIIDSYFYKYPGIKKYISDTIQFARDNGYVETLLNRRRYFPQINNSNNNIKTAMERAAINHPIQGTAADMMKLGMINVYKKMINQKLQSKMILQVHDEIVIDLIPDEEQIVRQILEKEMVSALILENVPIKVEIGIGKNWLEAH